MRRVAPPGYRICFLHVLYMSHDHHHAHEHTSDRRLVVALVLNLLLTVVEVAAGILSGSLALVADAVHNLSDCGSFVIALIARRIGRWPSDKRRTFGYRRAEIIGALINLTILIVISLFLIYEAAERIFSPRTIDGWMVVGIATLALALNVATTVVLYAMSRDNLNVRAAYLHNLADSFSSLGVIVAGAVILWFEVLWIDAVVTLLVALFTIWHSLPDIRRAIHILMEGAPSSIEADKLIAELQSVVGVAEVHHLHLWELDEHHSALEAHIVVEPAQLDRWATIKQELKLRLRQHFNIEHSTLEFETCGEDECSPCLRGHGHG